MMLVCSEAFNPPGYSSLRRTYGGGIFFLLDKPANLLNNKGGSACEPNTVSTLSDLLSSDC
jgi:hypothetical protein